MLVARNWANGEEMVKEYKVSVMQEKYFWMSTM